MKAKTSENERMQETHNTRKVSSEYLAYCVYPQCRLSVPPGVRLANLIVPSVLCTVIVVERLGEDSSLIWYAKLQTRRPPLACVQMRRRTLRVRRT